MLWCHQLPLRVPAQGAGHYPKAGVVATVGRGVVVAGIGVVIFAVVTEFVSFTKAEGMLCTVSKSVALMFVLVGDTMRDNVALKEPSAVLGFMHLLINVIFG